MRNRLLLQGLLLGLGLASFQPATAQYQWDWARLAAGRTTSYATTSATDPQGNTYEGIYLSADTSTATLDVGNGSALALTGSEAAAVVKYDPSGTCQWAVKLEANAARPSPVIKRIATDAAGNVIVTGICPDSTWFGAQVLRFPTTNPTTERQGFVGKLNAAGQWQWISALRGQWNGIEGATPAGLTTDQRGSIYVAGSFKGMLTAGSLTLASGWPNAGFFIARLSPTGQWQWARSPGGQSDTYSSAITDLKADATGEAYLVGTINSLAVFGTDTLHGHTWSGPGGPGPGVPPTWPADVFIARIDTAGQWQRAHDLGFGYVGRLTFGANGIYYVAGGFVDYEVTYASAAGTDTLRFAGGYVASFGPQGQRLDLRHFESDQQGPYFAAVSPDGTAYLMGTSQQDSLRFGPHVLPPRPDRMCYLAGLSADNQWLGVTEVTNPTVIDPAWLPATYLLDVQAAAGSVTVSGQHQGAATFGPTLPLVTPAVPAWQHQQFFLARFSTPLLGLPATPGAVSALQLWPNPAHGTVQVSTSTGGRVQVVDLLGRVVLTAYLVPGTSRLTISSLVPGAYIVRQGTAARRLVVE